MTITRTLTAATWCTTAVLAGALIISTYAPMLHGTAATPPSYSPAVQACMATSIDTACTDRPYIADAPAGQATLPPCPTEDSMNCYYNGYTMGDGTGRTFIAMGGWRYYGSGEMEPIK